MININIVNGQVKYRPWEGSGFLRFSNNSKENAKSKPKQKICMLDATNRTDNLKPQVITLLDSPPPKKTKSNIDENEESKELNTKLPYMCEEVIRILSTDQVVELPTASRSDSDLNSYTIQKIAWWFLKSENDPPMLEIIHPENIDNDNCPNNSDSWPADSKEYFQNEVTDDEESFCGNVSDPEGNRLREIKLEVNADEDEELFGNTSLEFGRIQNVFNGATSSKDFIIYLQQAPGTNISRASFRVKCMICNVNILGALGLGEHLRQESHKQKFRNLSLDLANYFEVWEKPKIEKLYNATLKSYDPNQNVTYSIGLDTQLPQRDDQTVISVKLSSLVSKRTFEHIEAEVNERLRPLKEEMEIKKMWSVTSHKKWILALNEEKKLIEMYYKDVDKFLNDIESYPRYTEEWQEFWYSKYDEVSALGKDAERFDYEAVWKKVWPKKLLSILKKETEEKILQMRQQLGMDFESLNKMASNVSSQNDEFQIIVYRHTQDRGFILPNNQGSFFPHGGHSNDMFSDYNGSRRSPPRYSNQNRLSPQHYQHNQNCSPQRYNNKNSRSHPRFNGYRGRSSRNVNRGHEQARRGSTNDHSRINQNIVRPFPRENSNRRNNFHNNNRSKGHPSHFNERKRNCSGNRRKNNHRQFH